MTKRYARIACAQVSQASNKLDAIFSGGQDAEKSNSAEDRHVSRRLAGPEACNVLKIMASPAGFEPALPP